MLFLLRPRQTWMPYALPRSRPQQDLYNQQLQKAYTSTRRVPPARAAAPRGDPLEDLKDLAQLRDAGMLTDPEFSTAKAKVLREQDAVT